MKKVVLSIVLTTTIAALTASAQIGESAKNIKATDYLFASQVSSAEQHISLMDKIQMETEELIMTIAPSPLVSLAHLIDKKLVAGKAKKANKRQNAKKEENTVQL